MSTEGCTSFGGHLSKKNSSSDISYESYRLFSCVLLLVVVNSKGYGGPLTYTLVCFLFFADKPTSTPPFIEGMSDYDDDNDSIYTHEEIVYIEDDVESLGDDDDGDGSAGQTDSEEEDDDNDDELYLE